MPAALGDTLGQAHHSREAKVLNIHKYGVRNVHSTQYIRNFEMLAGLGGTLSHAHHSRETKLWNIRKSAFRHVHRSSVAEVWGFLQCRGHRSRLQVRCSRRWRGGDAKVQPQVLHVRWAAAAAGGAPEVNSAGTACSSGFVFQRKRTFCRGSSVGRDRSIRDRRRPRPSRQHEGRVEGVRWQILAAGRRNQCDGRF